MSRIGKKPVEIPSGVKVSLSGSRMIVEGPKGKLEQDLVDGIDLAVEEGLARVSRASDSRAHRSNQGLIRSLLANMIVGVSKGYERRLEISGVGYRAEMNGSDLTLHLGFSHPVVHKIPLDVEVSVEKQIKVIVQGIDRQRVGQVAAIIRSTKSPDPYKVKGIMYEGERIKKKAGKKAVA